MGEGGVVDLGGVEGGEGNRAGGMGEGEKGSCLVGDERGKKTTGLMGETGKGEACFVEVEDRGVASLGKEEEVSGLVGEEGEAGLVGDEGGREVGLVGEERERETGLVGEE